MAPISIGFRLLKSPWQQDLAAVCGFAKENGFSFIDDIGPDSPAAIKQIRAAGLEIGSVDLPRPWDALTSPDAAKRRDAADRAAEYVKACVASGANIFFAVVYSEDNSRSRRENLGFAADGYGRLCQAIEATGAKIAVEGSPGKPPYYSALACTPEGYRAFFDAVGSDVVGVNFDPSHLVRMGIDPLRFLDEFGHRVWHVHAKDTVILQEDLYQFGNLQSATLAEPHKWGGHHWRYAIPGRGDLPWRKMLQLLGDQRISIELEDEEFNGTEQGEKRGLLKARDFLLSL